MNATVQATGMQVKAEAGSGLLISENIRPSLISVDFATSIGQKTLNPATYDEVNNKYYHKGEAEVDAQTGTVTGDLAEVNAAGYYQDYIVYIGTAGADLTNQTLYASVDFGLTYGASATASTSTHLAASIDFYVWDERTSVLDTDEKGYSIDLTDSSWKKVTTVNAASNDNPAFGTVYSDTSNDDTKVIPLATGLTIPTADGTGVVAVLMRVYFDGDLTATKAEWNYGADGVEGGEGENADTLVKPEYKYVRTSTVDVTALNINVKFEAH